MTLATVDGNLVAEPPDRAQAARRLTVWLTLGLLATMTSSLATGSAGTSLWGALGDLMQGRALSRVDATILWNVCLPRLLMGALVGASLAVSGAVMQGLFRNPLADPGLVGVSAGAGLGAISAIVLGAALPAALLVPIGAHLVPLGAFAGGGFQRCCFIVCQHAAGALRWRRCFWRVSRWGRLRGRYRGFWSMPPMTSNCAT